MVQQQDHVGTCMGDDKETHITWANVRFNQAVLDSWHRFVIDKGTHSSEISLAASRLHIMLDNWFSGHSCAFGFWDQSLIMLTKSQSLHVCFKATHTSHKTNPRSFCVRYPAPWI
jgi:hypothetical protein